MHPDNAAPILSILILTGNRDEMIKKCLKSIELSASIHNIYKEMEVVLAANETTPKINKLISRIKLKIDFYSLTGAGKSRLRNYAVSKSKGEIIYFIDDDSFVEPDFVSKIIDKFNKNKEAAVVGGPNLTPPDSGIFEEAQGFVLSSSWGAAGMSRRYRSADSDIETGQKSFSLCNLGFRRAALEKISYIFDERLNYNEENDLLVRLEEVRAKMFFSDINVFHYRRNNFKKFVEQVFESGQGRAKSIKINRNNVGLVYFFPLIFLLYLISLPLGFIFYGYMALFPLVVHFSVSLTVISANVVKFFKERKLKVLILSFPLFFIVHISYGAGMVSGFLKSTKRNDTLT